MVFPCSLMLPTPESIDLISNKVISTGASHNCLPWKLVMVEIETKFSSFYFVANLRGEIQIQINIFWRALAAVRSRTWKHAICTFFNNKAK